jgi:two-component system LytT family response regulator
MWLHLIRPAASLKLAMELTQSSKLMRVLIADDEPLARERIRELLERESDCEVAGECSDGFEALAKLRQGAVDLVFLDVEMPKLDGFGVLEALGGGSQYAVVFVTADDQYALRAFDEGAVDFLLKPFQEERFQKALDRARSALGRNNDPTSESGPATNGSSTYSAPLIVRTKGRLIFLRMRDIDYVRSAGNYVHIYAGGERYSVYSSMASVEERLDPALFIRIHRSAIVNVARIREAVPWFNGEHALVLQDGTELNIGRSYRDRFEQLMAS